MVNSKLMDKLIELGFGADVEALEKHVSLLQESASMGNPIASDAEYDAYCKLLKELKPTSEVLNRNWETEDNELDDNDELLKSTKMMSIRTVQELNELGKLASALGSRAFNMMASFKLNGHAIRAVYRYGELVSGSTRGRYKKGRDITRHLKATLPNFVPAWSNIRIREVRGEMLVSLDKFKAVSHILKSPLSAVTSFIRDSVTDSELENMTCLCYKIIDADGADTALKTLSDVYRELRENGFSTPEYRVYRGVTAENLEELADSCVELFSRLAEDEEKGGKFDTDGIVLSLDNLDELAALGTDGNSYIGNVALKMGERWYGKLYKSVIEEVVWTPGKKYMTPKARIRPTLTKNGSTVEFVPLYNVDIMQNNRLFTGQEIYFSHGGEQGVTLVKPDGTPISAK